MFLISSIYNIKFIRRILKCLNHKEKDKMMQAEDMEIVFEDGKEIMSKKYADKN